MRRGTGVPHRMAQFFGNEITITTLIPVTSSVLGKRLENPRRGTGVPHRTWQSSTFSKCATRDRGPTSHGEVFRQRNHDHNVNPRNFHCAGKAFRRFATRDRGPTSHVAIFHLQKMCDAGPSFNIAWQGFLATESRSQC